MNISQKKEFGVLVFGRNARLKLLEHVEFGEVGLGFVQVVEILSAPAKSFAGGTLDASRIDIALLENVLMLGAKVFADDSDNTHRNKITGGERKVSSGAAENVLDAARRRGDGVKCN